MGTGKRPRADADGDAATTASHESAASRQRQQPTVARQRRQRPIEVHVVEDHGDVLEHLYDAIGAKRAPFSGLRWVHLDSHPDLTLPQGLTPAVVMDPPALYRALEDSPGGNAEFILPAVFAGHVDEVWWVRPPWADQLPDGRQDFHVGVALQEEEGGPSGGGGCLRVSCPDTYYLDEGLYLPLHRMDPAQPCRPLRLRVGLAEDLVPAADDNNNGAAAATAIAAASETTTREEAAAAAAAAAPAAAAAETETKKAGAATATTARTASGWVLDVCLDYYATRNPFLDTLAQAAATATSEKGEEEEEACGVVRRFFGGPRFRQRGRQQQRAEEGTEVEVEVAAVQAELAAFNRLAARLLDAAEQAHATTTTKSEAAGAGAPSLLTAADAEALAALFPATAATDIVGDFAALLLRGGAPVVGAVRAMGGHCACLPAHKGGWGEVEGMLTATGPLVRRLCQDFGGPPSIVLVARSARDGYTPPDMVDAIEERLLAVLAGVPELAAAGLRVVKHYLDEEEGEEEEEGAGAG